MELDIKEKLGEWARVLKITRKPTREEFSAAAKITGIGLVVIGMLGFAIFLLLTIVKI